MSYIERWCGEESLPISVRSFSEEDIDGTKWLGTRIDRVLDEFIFEALSEMEEFLDEDALEYFRVLCGTDGAWDVQRDLLNNYLVLFSVWVHAQLPAPEVSLAELVEKTEEGKEKGWNYEEFSRAINMLPWRLKEMFKIRRSPNKRNYTIQTHYPRLLMEVLHGARHAPFSEKKDTADSYLFNERFLNACLPPPVQSGGAWTQIQLEEYYIAERLFRLDMKRYLFQNVFSQRKQQIGGTVKTLSELLFHSPLVLQNNPEIWSQFLLSDPKQEMMGYETAALFNMLIQIEARITPVCMYRMRRVANAYESKVQLLEMTEATIDLHGLTQKNWLLTVPGTSKSRHDREQYKNTMGGFYNLQKFLWHELKLRKEYAFEDLLSLYGTERQKFIIQTALDWL